jgi:protoheme IX farnesyltransferase
VSGKLVAYYRLTKPGIIRGNLLATSAGFLFASGSSVSWTTFVYLLVGTTLIIASGCVANNIIDSDIDGQMDRTKKRSLVTGELPRVHAVYFSLLTLLLGSTTLLLLVNWLTLLVGLFGWVLYVVAYSMYAKRRSAWGTFVGALPGAAPPVAGYVAVTGSLDVTSLLLFVSMVCWQMPHFYAIAIYRKRDYEKASIPVLSVTSGLNATKRQIIGFIALYAGTNIALFAVGAASAVFLVVMSAVSLWWLQAGLQPLSAKSAQKWGHKVFGISLLVLLVWSLLLSIEVFLP